MWNKISAQSTKVVSCIESTSGIFSVLKNLVQFHFHANHRSHVLLKSKSAPLHKPSFPALHSCVKTHSEEAVRFASEKDGETCNEYIVHCK